jgi:hypothetical protein
MRVWNPESFCPWIRDGKIRIRDKTSQIRNTAKLNAFLRNKFFQGCIFMLVGVVD